MSKTICNYPFRHLYVDTNGHQKVCCMPDEYIEKDCGYRQYTMNDGLLPAWNSDYMKDMRMKMIRGEKVAACSKCYKLESLGLKSLRTEAGLNNIENYTSQINSDGSLNTMPEAIELHFGNVCNLKCTMCSHYFSHMWGKELLAIKDKDPIFFKWIQQQGGNVNNWSTGDLGKVYDWFKDRNVLMKVFDDISDHITKIQAIGGEPTIISEFWELFEYLKEKKTLEKKELQLTTNGTNINKKIVGYFTEMKNVDIMISLDGLNQRNRYIRFPSNWNTIYQNLKTYQELSKQTNSMHCWLAFTPQILNIDQLVEFIIFFQEQNYVVRLNPNVVSPKIYDINYFPYEYKKFIKQKLLKDFDKIKDDQNRNDVQQIIKSLEVEPNQNEVKQNIQNFTKYMDYMDNYRKEDSWRSLIPELEKSIINF